MLTQTDMEKATYGPFFEITKAMREHPWFKDIITQGFEMVVGQGDKFLVWKSNWTSLGLLKDNLPRLYDLSMQQHLFISEVGV